MSPPSTMRTHAATVSLCTSRPAQRGYITSMTSSPVASPAWGTSTGNSIKRAPDREGHWHNQGCSKCPRSNSFSGSEHHDDDRPLCRRPPSLASVSSSRVGRKGRCVTHSQIDQSFYGLRSRPSRTWLVGYLARRELRRAIRPYGGGRVRRETRPEGPHPGG